MSPIWSSIYSASENVKAVELDLVLRVTSQFPFRELTPGRMASSWYRQNRRPDINQRNFAAARAVACSCPAGGLLIVMASQPSKLTSNKPFIILLYICTAHTKEQQRVENRDHSTHIACIKRPSQRVCRSLFFFSWTDGCNLFHGVEQTNTNRRWHPPKTLKILLAFIQGERRIYCCRRTATVSRLIYVSLLLASARRVVSVIGVL